MFRKVGIDKNKFYDSLIKVGTDGMKTKQMKEEWSVENPTKNNCYMVSEFIYKYLDFKGTKHLSIKVDGDTLPHHYLKWDDGTIIDLTLLNNTMTILSWIILKDIKWFHW